MTILCHGPSSSQLLFVVRFVMIIVGGANIKLELERPKQVNIKTRYAKGCSNFLPPTVADAPPGRPVLLVRTAIAAVAADACSIDILRYNISTCMSD